MSHALAHVPTYRVLGLLCHMMTLHDRRRGPDRELTSIPQPERYSSADWIHNIINLPGSQVLQRIRGPIILNMIWAFIVSVRAAACVHACVCACACG